MQSPTLGKVWTHEGKKKGVKVRFHDWNHQIKFFVIHGESPDGKRLVGVLDSGERMSYSKRSYGWALYQEEAELSARAV